MANIYGDIKNIEKVGTAYNVAAKGTLENDVKTQGKPGSVDELLGYSYKKDDMTQKVKKSVAEGFDEYMKTILEKEKQDSIDEAAKEREQKKNEREIAGSLTDEEIAMLSMMGIDIESAKLSDIMGMVNSMRGEAHRDKMQKLLAEITMSEASLENTIVTAEGVVASASGVELENVDVADVIATENDFEEDIKFTRDDFLYLIKNELDINKENLYKAHYSGSKAADEVSDKVIHEMQPQLEKVIAQTGIDVDEESLEGARLLLKNELPVSTDNIRKYMGVKEYFDKNVSELLSKLPKTDETEAARKLYYDVHSIEPDVIYDMSKKGMDITIASARVYMQTYVDSPDRHKNKEEIKEFLDNENAMSGDKRLKAVSDMRNLEEIRLSMTMEAATKMIKQDINIDTRELSQVVARLKELEQRLIADSLSRNGVEPTEENISLVSEINDKVSSLAEAPAAVIATPIVSGGFSVNALSEAAILFGKDELPEESESLSQDKVYETAKRSYEAVGTKVRTDLGDSITKAFSNVDDILKELSLPVNYETQRAVRILGYNRLEITEANINDVVNYDRQVNTLIDGFYPEAVMGLIKDGINPLDVPIDELNKIIVERNYNEGVTEAENFATYLRDVEKLGEITAEERASYIGIYRIMDKLSKSGDREAGWLLGNGGRLTVRNLISALRSRKATGMDVDIDDDFGLISDINEKGSRIDKQIESAFLGNEKGYDEESYKQDILAINDLHTMSFMEQQQIEMTMVNAKAVYAMLNEGGGIYSLVSDILAKLRFNSDAKENAVDEETENMTASMLGEEIENNISMESILESIGSENLSLKYDDIRSQLETALYNASAMNMIKSGDFSMVKTIMAGFNIMKKMSERDFYQIPCETKQGISVINLTIRHDAENNGNINVRYDSELYGNIEASLTLKNENNISGSITASGSEGNTLLMKNMQEIRSLFDEQGYNAEEVSLGQIAANDTKNEAYQSKKALYNAAIVAVRVLSSI